MSLAARALTVFLGLWTSLALAGEVRQIPDEYETTSGHGVAMNNAGYAANDADSAIRANPALLSMTKEYTVSAGYHWPVVGRDYFQAGIVDSKTSSVAAGVSYTGFTDNYQYVVPGDKTPASAYDSPIIRRGAVAASQNFGSMSIGVGATYVEANSLKFSPEWQDGQKKVKGVGLNMGVATVLSSEVSLGGSVENASNRKIANYVPKTYHAGVAYHMSNALTGYLDARQRDRVPEFEADQSVDLDDPKAESKILNNPERMVIASFVGQVQEYLRLIGSYAQSTTDDRRSLAGGIAVMSKNFSLSYTASRPYMKQSGSHQAVALSLDMAM